ncbi:MAG: hypothetical protein EOO74_04315 [Myxococcales bacterium]|nr:MAG: hypothetical protein EOO74_04315 [Myxococcales bacterium]
MAPHSSLPERPSSAPRRASHLMDPSNLQAHRTTQRSLSRVQRWVLSTLVVTTVLHMSGGLVVAAYAIDESRTDARIGLLIIAGAFGMAAFGAGLLVHKHRLLSPWLLLGWIPSLVGAWWLFGR